MYQFSDRSFGLQSKLSDFMDAYIYPNENAYAAQLHSASNRCSAMPSTCRWGQTTL